MDYVTDHGNWLSAVQNGALAASTDPFPAAVANFYIKTCPLNDPWNFPYQVFTGEANSSGAMGGADAADFGDDDFVILSQGRDNGPGPNYSSDSYKTSTPEAGFYQVSGMADFDEDLVAWSGNWVCGPRAALARR